MNGFARIDTIFAWTRAQHAWEETVQWIFLWVTPYIAKTYCCVAWSADLPRSQRFPRAIALNELMLHAARQHLENILLIKHSALLVELHAAIDERQQIMTRANNGLFVLDRANNGA